MVFEWRNRPEIVALGTSRKTVTWGEHAEWFAVALSGDRRLVWIIEPNAGTVRLDRDGDRAIATIYLLSDFQGRSLGPAALREACEEGLRAWPIHTIVAQIRVENVRSIKAFVKAGFVIEMPRPHTPEGHLVVTKWRSSGHITDHY